MHLKRKTKIHKNSFILLKIYSPEAREETPRSLHQEAAVRGYPTHAPRAATSARRVAWHTGPSTSRRAAWTHFASFDLLFLSLNMFEIIFKTFLYSPEDLLSAKWKYSQTPRFFVIRRERTPGDELKQEIGLVEC